MVILSAQAHLRLKRETQGADKQMFSRAESEFILDPYDLQREILNRYMVWRPMFLSQHVLHEDSDFYFIHVSSEP